MTKEVLVDRTMKCTYLSEEHRDRVSRIFDAVDGMEVHKAKKLLGRCSTALQLLDIGYGDGTQMSKAVLLDKMRTRLGLSEKYRDRAGRILDAVAGLDIACAESVLLRCSEGLQLMEVEFTGQ